EALRLDVDAAIVGKAGALVEARVLRIVVLLGAEQRQRAEELAVEELALEAQLVALADRGAERREVLPELRLRLVDVAVAPVDPQVVGEGVRDADVRRDLLLVAVAKLVEVEASRPHVDRVEADDQAEGVRRIEMGDAVEPPNIV